MPTLTRRHQELSPQQTGLIGTVVLATGHFFWLLLELERLRREIGGDPLDDNSGWALVNRVTGAETVALAVLLGLGTWWLLRISRGVAVPDGLLPVRGRWTGSFLLANALTAGLTAVWLVWGIVGELLLLALWWPLLLSYGLALVLHRFTRHRTFRLRV